MSRNKVRYCTTHCGLNNHGRDIFASVSHHPPISAYFYLTPANKVLITGELRPKSRFLGNSVSTIMEGVNRVRLMGKQEDGGTYPFSHRCGVIRGVRQCCSRVIRIPLTDYVITMPNMYARGEHWSLVSLHSSYYRTPSFPSRYSIWEYGIRAWGYKRRYQRGHRFILRSTVQD